MDLRALERISPGDWFYDVGDQLKWHVYRRSEECFRSGDAQRDALRNVSAIRHHQETIRSFFIESLGGLPEDHAPIEPKVTGSLRGAGFKIEKLLYESRPGHWVTSLLYLPDDRPSRSPAVLFLCGHAAQGKAYPEYQRVCQLLAREGFIVLAQDPIGQGERLSYWEPSLGSPLVAPCTQEHDHAGAQCVPLGWSLARFFLHDARRSLEYLCSRPDVDPERIGLTGNSGGGTQSCLLMLTDPRIAAAAPGTFIMNRQTYMYSGGAQDAEQMWPGFTGAGYDHEDVLIAMAPRPVCVLAATEDFFPIEGTRRTVERCRPIWEAFGIAGMPELVEDKSSHAYTPRLAEAAARFFARELQGRDAAPDYAATRPFDEHELYCTASGQVCGDLPDARFVFEECCMRAAELAEARGRRSRAERRQAAVEYLRKAVLRDRRPCAFNPRRYWSGRVSDLDVEARIWWSQEDLLGHALVFTRAGRDATGSPVVLALWDGGTRSVSTHWEWITSRARAGEKVVVLDVSGVGALTPHSLQTAYPPVGFYGVIHKLADDLTWMGDSLAALRVHDVLRALQMLRSEDAPSSLRIYGDARSGRHCLYGILAGALEPEAPVEVDGPTPSMEGWVRERYYDPTDIKSVLLPGFLEICDLPDLLSD